MSSVLVLFLSFRFPAVAWGCTTVLGAVYLQHPAHSCAVGHSKYTYGSSTALCLRTRKTQKARAKIWTDTIKIFIRASMHSPSPLPESSALKFKLQIKLICMLNSGHPYLRPIGTKRFCCNWISSLLWGARISLQTQHDPLRHTAVQTIRPH